MAGEFRAEQAQAIAQLRLAGRDEFRRGRRRLRAAVRREIAEGEVGLVADGGDDRGAARADGADELLVVEAPQVLHRAAAAADHDQVDAGDRVGLLQAVDHRAGAALALHAGGH